MNVAFTDDGAKEMLKRVKVGVTLTLHDVITAHYCCQLVAANSLLSDELRNKAKEVAVNFRTIENNTMDELRRQEKAR